RQVGAGVEELVDPVARWVQLDAEARSGGDERPPRSVFLDAQVELVGARDRRREVVLVEDETDVVDAGHLPLAGLDDDVDGALLEFGQAVLEADAVQLLPRDAWLVAAVLVLDAAVARDEAEAELRQVPGLDLAHPARHEVVV